MKKLVSREIMIRYKVFGYVWSTSFVRLDTETNPDNPGYWKLSRNDSRFEDKYFSVKRLESLIDKKVSMIEHKIDKYRNIVFKAFARVSENQGFNASLSLNGTKGPGSVKQDTAIDKCILQACTIRMYGSGVRVIIEAENPAFVFLVSLEVVGGPVLLPKYKLERTCELTDGFITIVLEKQDLGDAWLQLQTLSRSEEGHVNISVSTLFGRHEEKQNLPLSLVDCGGYEFMRSAIARLQPSVLVQKAALLCTLSEKEDVKEMEIVLHQLCPGLLANDVIESSRTTLAFVAEKSNKGLQSEEYSAAIQKFVAYYHSLQVYPERISLELLSATEGSLKKGLCILAGATVGVLLGLLVLVTFTPVVKAVVRNDPVELASPAAMPAVVSTYLRKIRKDFSTWQEKLSMLVLLTGAPEMTVDSSQAFFAVESAILAAVKKHLAGKHHSLDKLLHVLERDIENIEILLSGSNIPLHLKTYIDGPKVKLQVLPQDDPTPPMALPSVDPNGILKVLKTLKGVYHVHKLRKMLSDRMGAIITGVSKSGKSTLVAALCPASQHRIVRGHMSYKHKTNALALFPFH
eukprot:g25663.t1